MAKETIRVRGYREFVRASDRAGRDSKRFVRSALKEAGDVVRIDSTARLAAYDTRSAAGLRTRVRTRGVSVDQTRRKTTGLHPEFGKLQMRILIGSLNRKQRAVEEALEHAVDQIADHFDEN